MNANQLLDNFNAAKAALWEYLSTEEDTYLHLDVFDFRQAGWTGVPTTEGLAWSWNIHDDNWEYRNVKVETCVVKDDLTFVWYDDGAGMHWAVFSNKKAGDKTP